MSTYPHNSFAPLLDAFNTERAPFAPWFNKLEMVGMAPSIFRKNKGETPS